MKIPVSSSIRKRPAAAMLYLPTHIQVRLLSGCRRGGKRP